MKRYIISLGLIGISCDCSLISNAAATGTSVGLKVGTIVNSQIKYSDKAEKPEASSIDIIKPDFSAKESNTGYIIEGFINREFYRNGPYFIQGELGLAISGGHKANFDTLLKERLDDTFTAGPQGYMQIKENFSGNIAANFGYDINAKNSVYAKMGLDLANFKTVQAYDPDTETDNDPPYYRKDNKIIPGLLIGMGFTRKISEKAKFLIEGSHVIRKSTKLKDNYTDYNKTSDDLETNFKNRKISTNRTQIKIGVSFDI